MKCSERSYGVCDWCIENAQESKRNRLREKRFFWLVVLTFGIAGIPAFRRNHKTEGRDYE
jgi:hypothetical protein